MTENESEHSPEEEFQRMLNELLSGSGVDPAQLAGAAGLPNDPASLAALMNQLRQSMSGPDGGVNWSVAIQHGEQQAAQDERQIEPGERSALEQAANLAELWLDEATSFATVGSTVRLLTRRQWVTATMPVWSELSTPMATSVSNSLTNVMQNESPEELQSMVAGAGSFLRNIGGTLFAMQLGHVVGQLSKEVISGGDVGIPLFTDGQAVLLPQNVSNFGDELSIPASEIALYVAVRELAHARLFKHARWLRLEFMSSLTEFAKGVHIDVERLHEVAEGLDPSNPEQLQAAIRDGSLIPPKSDQQLAALARIETTLALIEGWVDAVTAEATKRMPSASAIAETIRRRRASGGPAESAFGALVGLELRPRRLREAAAMWVQLGEAVGLEARDALWQHPDSMPTGDDIDAPAALIARLTGAATPSAEDLAFDAALDELLRGETPPAPEQPTE
ncbi:MAG: zinc-dependent metalloprotease [Microbacteriaceae bacterium]